METNKTISVVVPLYNYSQYIGACLDSVLAQSITPHEIIVVNDGSTDNWEQALAPYLDKIKIVNKANGGLSSARNAGIAIATCEFCMTLDADDVLPPNSLKYHLELAGQKKIAQCGLQEFGARDRMYWPQGATLHSMTCGNTVYCNAVFPKKIWELVGGYDESEIMRLGLEDYEFWLICMDRGCRVVTRPEIGLLYRIHPESMTRTTTHKNYSKIMDYIREKNKKIFGLFG